VDLEARLREGPLRIRQVWSEDKSAQLAGKVLRLRRRRSLLRASLSLSAAACALAGAVVVRGALVAPAPDATLARAPATAAAAIANVPPSPRTVVLHDGSRAELAGEDSLLAVVGDQPERVRVHLQRGTARFSVVRNPKRRFEVESGPVLVRVVGTTFSVTRTQEGARVAVEEGRVLVSWAGEQLALGAGESGVFPRTEAATDDIDAVAERRSGWRDLAKRGDYRSAYSALHRTRDRVRDQPEDRMLAADVARLSGHPEQAVPHLRAVSQRFARDPRAPVAAFTLGRVLLHDLDEPQQAAAAFHRARTLWPRGPLALDAWASEAEALRAAGDASAAAAVAARYLARHPRGRHAAAMRAVSGTD
jgi:transmembrane sensor